MSLRLRDDITVPEGARLRADGVHSALLADGGPVAEFLADAEPRRMTLDSHRNTEKALEVRAAHAQPNSDRARPTASASGGRSRKGSTGRAPAVLLVRGPSRRRKWPHKAATSADSAAHPPDFPPSRPRHLTIDREDGGFTVKAGPGLTADSPSLPDPGEHGLRPRGR